MATLENLPPDQRAVLQLVLQRGRSYDEIAQMLSIDRAGVRQRARSAFDALGPRTRLADERRALITDYLLGQLPADAKRQTHDRLAGSAPERAWARVVASEIGSLASDPLPEIPVDSGRAERAVDDEPVGVAATREQTRRPERPHPSSRRGGTVLLGLLALLLIAAVVIVIALSGGSSTKHKAAAGTQTGAVSVPTTGTSTTGTQLIAQVNLVAPGGTKKTAGVAQVVRQGANTGLVIVAQGVPANTSHDAYAVWLYNSATDSHILGFVNPGVRTNGKLQTAGVLPSNASHYKQLLVTLETQAKPHGPGKILLEGAFSL